MSKLLVWVSGALSHQGPLGNYIELPQSCASLGLANWSRSPSTTMCHCLRPTFGSINTLSQFSAVTQLCPALWDLMNRSTPGFPVQHQLPESTQTHIHRVSDAIQPSYPPSSPSSPVPNPSQHQGLYQWFNSSHELVEVLEFQLQHQSFQWTPRADLL